MGAQVSDAAGAGAGLPHQVQPHQVPYHWALRTPRTTGEPLSFLEVAAGGAGRATDTSLPLGLGSSPSHSYTGPGSPSRSHKAGPDPSDLLQRPLVLEPGPTAAPQVPDCVEAFQGRHPQGGEHRPPSPATAGRAGVMPTGDKIKVNEEQVREVYATTAPRTRGWQGCAHA